MKLAGTGVDQFKTEEAKELYLAFEASIDRQKFGSTNSALRAVADMVNRAKAADVGALGKKKLSDERAAREAIISQEKST